MRSTAVAPDGPAALGLAALGPDAIGVVAGVPASWAFGLARTARSAAA